MLQDYWKRDQSFQVQGIFSDSRALKININWIDWIKVISSNSIWNKILLSKKHFIFFQHKTNTSKQTKGFKEKKNTHLKS